MKITVNVECTPEEARTFLGLPDVKVMTAAVEDRVRQAITDATPEGMMRYWSSLVPTGAEELQKLMASFLQGTAGKPGAKPGG
jgi:Family of unknown function (DUF6489)